MAAHRRLRLGNLDDQATLTEYRTHGSSLDLGVDRRRPGLEARAVSGMRVWCLVMGLYERVAEVTFAALFEKAGFVR